MLLVKIAVILTISFKAFATDIYVNTGDDGNSVFSDTPTKAYQNTKYNSLPDDLIELKEFQSLLESQTEKYCAEAKMKNNFEPFYGNVEKCLSIAKNNFHACSLDLHISKSTLNIKKQALLDCFKRKSTHKMTYFNQEEEVSIGYFKYKLIKSTLTVEANGGGSVIITVLIKNLSSSPQRIPDLNIIAESGRAYSPIFISNDFYDFLEAKDEKAIKIKFIIPIDQAYYLEARGNYSSTKHALIKLDMSY